MSGLDPFASRRAGREPSFLGGIWSPRFWGKIHRIRIPFKNWDSGEILGVIFGHFGGLGEARGAFYIEPRRGLERGRLSPARTWCNPFTPTSLENVEFDQFRTSRWSPTHSRYFALLRPSGHPGPPPQAPQVLPPQLPHILSPTHPHPPQTFSTKLFPPSAYPQPLHTPLVLFFFKRILFLLFPPQNYYYPPLHNPSNMHHVIIIIIFFTASNRQEGGAGGEKRRRKKKEFLFL